MRDFQHTLNVLVKAYLNNTLAHSCCSACAVGNIIADSLNIKVCKDYDGSLVWGNKYPQWGKLFMTDSERECQTINIENLHDTDVMHEIDSTGYTWEELARIEFAFETAVGFCEDDFDNEWMFNGLMAVVDVLADIHGIDLKVREEAKSLFVKA